MECKVKIVRQENGPTPVSKGWLYSHKGQHYNITVDPKDIQGLPGFFGGDIVDSVVKDLERRPVKYKLDNLELTIHL